VAALPLHFMSRHINANLLHINASGCIVIPLQQEVHETSSFLPMLNDRSGGFAHFE
jgi:hypothetical protein